MPLVSPGANLYCDPKAGVGVCAGWVGSRCEGKGLEAKAQMTIWAESHGRWELAPAGASLPSLRDDAYSSSSPRPCKVDTVVIPSFQMRRLRQRARGCKAKEMQRQE